MADIPDAGREFETGASPVRVIGFGRRIMVAYRVEKARIIVTRVFYAGQDWKRELQAPED